MSYKLEEGGWRDPEVNIVWPEPPAEARVELLRVVSSIDSFSNQERKNVFFSWLFGGTGEPYFPLVSPYGIVSDGQGRIWVADSGRGYVQLFDLVRRNVDFIGQAGDVPLVSPVGVAYDKDKDVLYVSDSGLRKVFVFSVSGDYLGEVVRPGGFKRPAGLVVDKGGALYIVDVVRGVVDLFDRDGDYRRSIGSAVGDNGLFNHPSNVAVDSEGRIYVVDSLRFQVEVQDIDGNLVGLIGQLGDGVGAFSRPRGVAVDSGGHIYVVDAAFDNVQIFDLTGRLLLVIGGPGGEPGKFCLPAGLFIDDFDRIYVTDACNYRFQVLQYLGGVE